MSKDDIYARVKAFDWKYAVLAAFSPCFTLFGFGILEILSGIWDSVWFDVTHIIGLALLLLAGGFFAILVTGFVINMLFPKLLPWYWAIVFAVAVACYVQGNYLRTSFGEMDGNFIDWSQYRSDAVISVGFWILLIAAVLFLVKRKGMQSFRYISKLVMIFILLIQVVTLTVLAFTTDMLTVKNNPEYSTENEFVYSKEDNMIILVLDAYDSQVFDCILENPEGVDYDGLFENFTYYPNTVGAFSRTYYAIPHILTGEAFKNDQDYDDYLNDAYRHSLLFQELQQKNYSIGLYTNAGFPTDEDVYSGITNYIPKGTNRMKVSSNRRMLGYLIRFVGIRYLPTPLKQYCWFYSGELYDVRNLDGHRQVYSINNHNFLWDSEDMVSTAQTNMFHFYHVEGVHSPYCFDRYFNKTDKSAFDKESLIEAGRGILVMVQQYFDELKALGIYDDATIVVMADHGGQWVSDTGTLLRRHNPLLLVKGKNETHEFTVSEAPVSYDDLQEAYVRLLNGVTGEDVFDAKEGDQRERIYINDSDFTEYVLIGDAFDYDALQPTGKIYK